VLKINILANNIGQIWRIGSLLIATPIFIGYLGVEAYSLIAIFTMMQVWMGLLDLGLRPALAREMSRFVAGVCDSNYILTLLLTVEIIMLVIGVIVMLGIWGLSDWLAMNWVNELPLKHDIKKNIFTIIGFMLLLRLVEGIYSGALAGLQRQVLQNGILVFVSTLQNFGAIIMLAWFGAGIEGFFLWQLTVALISLIILRIFSYRSLPSVEDRIHFSLPVLSNVSGFALGMIGITIVGILVTQIDKMLASTILNASAFSYYMLAALIASGLDFFVAPISSAIYPRLVELKSLNEEKQFITVFHKGAQSISVLVGSLAGILFYFSDRILFVWLNDSNLSKEISPIMTIMVVGALAHSMIWIPYQAQLAYKWTSLTMKINSVGILFSIPLLSYLSIEYGAIGMAWAGVILNMGLVFFGMQFMFKKILIKEKIRWYVNGVLMPVSVSFIVAFSCSIFMPKYTETILEIIILCFSFLIVLLVTVIFSPLVRGVIYGNYLRYKKYLGKLSL
jgi:O-antigen/teichoic acid export membrane protein